MVYIEEFVRNRITQLRLQKDVSEYQMSYDLGHSRSYINNISSGKTLPSMSEFFAICEYFQITPLEFFDQKQKYPELVTKALSKFVKLDESDMLLFLSLLNRLLDTK
jgi:transcriptional regulator with XRE-family HTH domain